MGRRHGRRTGLLTALAVVGACALPGAADAASWVTVSGGVVLREPEATIDLAGLHVRALSADAAVDVDLGAPEPRVTFSGRPCAASGGDAGIREVARDDGGRVVRLWAWYEQRCGDDPPLTGEVRVGYPPDDEPFTVPAALRVADPAGKAEPVELVAGAGPLLVTGVEVGPADGEVAQDACLGRTLDTGAACRVWVRATGDATLRLETSAGLLTVPVEVPAPPPAAFLPLLPAGRVDLPPAPAPDGAAPSGAVPPVPADVAPTAAAAVAVGSRAPTRTDPTAGLCPTSRLATLSAPRGSNRADRIFGASRSELIRARGGDDEVFAGPGDDCVDGGSGRDRLDGGPGRDVLLGGAGNDALVGGRGRDLLLCGTGTDTAIAGPGDRTRGCERALRAKH